MLGIENPRVGLLNIGVEAEKGTDLQRQTRALLLEQPKLNFIGNIEAKEAIKGGCDVLVTDGFSGNVMLKTIEGIGSYAGSCLKGIFKKNLLTKLAGAMVLPGLNAFKAQLDPNKVGGTAFIGISKRGHRKRHRSGQGGGGQRLGGRDRRPCGRNDAECIIQNNFTKKVLTGQ